MAKVYDEPFGSKRMTRASNLEAIRDSINIAIRLIALGHPRAASHILGIAIHHSKTRRK